jgi:hypothetical protein
MESDTFCIQDRIPPFQHSRLGSRQVHLLLFVRDYGAFQNLKTRHKWTNSFSKLNLSNFDYPSTLFPLYPNGKWPIIQNIPAEPYIPLL